MRVATASSTRLQLDGAPSLLAKHLAAALTALGIADDELPPRLLAVMRSGLQHLNSAIGVYALDSHSYHEFAPLFEPIIRDYHGGTLIRHQPASGAEVAIPDAIPGVLSSRVRFARNLREFPFGPEITAPQRTALEHTVVATLRSLDGTEFAGVYSALDTMPRSQFRALVRGHWLSEANDPYLHSAGFYRDYPRGRGIFLTNDGRMAVIVNEEDALRIVAMQSSGRLREVYERVSRLAALLEERLAFAYDERLGYLACCPSNIGTGMRASVHMLLPQFQPDELRAHALLRGLQVRGQYGEQDALDAGRPYDISHRRRLGASEAELIGDLYRGVVQIAELHGARS
jgi:protein-arginine kinase